MKIKKKIIIYYEIHKATVPIFFLQIDKIYKMLT
jgi:hypothetical protein